VKASGRDGDVGAAFVFAVLLMLALLVLAHGALVSSLSELATSRAAVRDLEARAAAEAAVRGALSFSPGRWMDSVATWEAGPTVSRRLGRAESVGALTRLAPETWLVEGTGVVGEGAGVRTARMVWSLDPLERIAALASAVSIGVAEGATLEGVVDASAPTAVQPPLEEGDCDVWLPALDARYLRSPLTSVTLRPDTLAAPGLGLLDFAALLEATEISIGGVGTPAPVESFGACVLDEPWGWGDPDRRWRPCGAHLPLRGASTDLRVEGGVGQGILVVDGDLTLTEGVRYFGLLVVSGELRIQDGARFEGMALVRSVRVGTGAMVTASACWAVRALDAHRDMIGRWVPLAGLERIGPL
jgi:hypothetical protein